MRSPTLGVVLAGNHSDDDGLDYPTIRSLSTRKPGKKGKQPKKADQGYGKRHPESPESCSPHTFPAVDTLGRATRLPRFGADGGVGAGFPSGPGRGADTLAGGRTLVGSIPAFRSRRSRRTSIARSVTAMMVVAVGRFPVSRADLAMMRVRER